MTRAAGLRATEVVRSSTWAAAAPTATVLVSTYRRPHLLPGLLAALEAQTEAGPYEVVVADNGSGDRTWTALQRLVASTPLPVTALRLPDNVGPGPARNRCAEQGRSPLLLLTDDDCLPAPDWVAALTVPFAAADVVVVQGRTLPEPGDAPGAWARSVWVTAPTPWFETCNVAYRRTAYQAVGGFDEHDPLFDRGRGGRPFGEDAWLAGRVLQAGGRAVWAPDALVHHRWLPGSFRDHLAERRHMRGFPALARRLPTVADSCWHGVFLSRRTAEFDLALAATVAALTTRRALLLVGAAPWLRTAWGPLRARRGPRTLRLAQGALADVAGLVALAEGSVRHRRLVL